MALFKGQIQLDTPCKVDKEVLRAAVAMCCSKNSWIFWSVFFCCTLFAFKWCKQEQFKQSLPSFEAGCCHQFRLLFLCVAGPAHWKEVFPVANGDRQSPIDIKTEETKYDPSLRPLNPNYDPASAKIILNNGHSTSVEFDDTVNKSGLFFCCCTVSSSTVSWIECMQPGHVSLLGTNSS